MRMNSPAFRRTALAAAVMLAAMAVLWWTIWAVSAAQFRSFVDDWIAAHSAAGYKMHYDARLTGGFPRRITLHFTNFVLENSDGIRVHSDNIDLSTLPWRWHHLTAKTTHGFDLAIPFSDKTVLTVAADAAKSHITLDANGDWRSLQLEVTNGKALWAQKPFFSGDRLAIALARPEEEPKDHTEAGLTLAAEADNLVLPPDLVLPFGSKVAHIDIGARVMGAVPDPRKKSSITAWNAANGMLAFDRLDLDWGKLLFAARGTLGLDDDLQPEGAFVSQIGNQKEVLRDLMENGEIPKHDAGMLDEALNLFAKPASIDGVTGIEAPITVQLGGLFLGPVRVFEYSEVLWEPDTAPTEATPAASTTPAPVSRSPAVPVETPAPPAPPADTQAPASAPAATTSSPTP
jgi:hypothetical protein